jgi:hypothetical protein
MGWGCEMRYLAVAWFLTLALVDRFWLLLVWPLAWFGIHGPAIEAALWVTHRDEQVRQAWKVW